jgi:ubiquitin C-terminal hydrolase
VGLGNNSGPLSVSFGGNGILNGSHQVDDINLQQDESKDPSAKAEEEAMEAWKNHLMKNKSVIVDLFQGQLKSTLECQVCHFQSTKFDCLMYLSVPIA